MPSHDIITAVPLSFADDGSIDWPGSRAILQYVADSGVQGALILGTTAEFPSLSIEERDKMTGLALEVLREQRVIVHVGAASMFEVSRLIAGARSAGAGEIAVLTPFYLPAQPAQVYDFYRAVSDEASDLDIYLYLFEARTGVAVDGDLLARLAALPGVVGVKVSGENLDRVSSYRSRLSDDFVVYTGSDADFATAHEAGADGVISGVASAFARPFVAMQRALRAGDTTAISLAGPDIAEAVDAIHGEPSRMRAVHRLAGSPVGGSRMPIAEPDEQVLARLRDGLSRMH